MKKYIAEFIGAAALVLLGCGAVTIGGLGAALGAQPAAVLPIALAFGMTVTGMAYGIGPVSGCHVNPAVTLGVWTAGRMPTSEVPGYIISQVLGAIVGAGILYIILSGKSGGWDFAKGGMGENGWGEGYGGGYPMAVAFLTEFVATFIFLTVILGSTSKAGATPVAGLAIGITLAILIVAFVNVSGLSVNPARSLGPAIFLGGKALAQSWLFIVAPIAGAMTAGALFKARILEA